MSTASRARLQEPWFHRYGARRSIPYRNPEPFIWTGTVRNHVH